jgi:hypothetical protein
MDLFSSLCYWYVFKENASMVYFLSMYSQVLSNDSFLVDPKKEKEGTGFVLLGSERIRT